eukprot:gene18145-21697_t
MAEIIRMLLVYKEVEFEDRRVANITPELRATLPFGQIPFYEDQDIKICQSSAIARYVATKYDLAGSNVKERARIDELVASVWDPLTQFYGVGQDAEKLAKFKNETLVRFLNSWEKLLLENSGSRYFVGQSVTWADIAIFHVLEYLIHLGFKDILPSDNLPTLTNFFKDIGSIPSIAAHVKARPDTKF